MKTIKIFKLEFIILLLSLTTVFGFSSCKDSKKEDTKEVAEDHNEAKFDDTNKEEDSKFLTDAAEINLSEIQLGKLAQTNGKMEDVKNMGKMMEDEHTKALADLRGLAAKKQITLPASNTDEGMAEYKSISEKKGMDFDKAYCDAMVDGHKAALDKFEKAAKDSKDADIKAWASSMVPTLRTHLDHAITCQKKCEKM